MNNSSKLFRLRIAVLAVVSLAAMGYIDYITGYELVFSAAYLLPVSLCGWYFGRREVWLMATASGFTSWLVDILSGHQYEHSLIQYWNGFMCFVVSLSTGLLLLRLRRILEERKQMNENLLKALNDLKRSTEEIRQLQDGLQVVCAWTKRIQVGDQWITPEEFLQTQLHLKLTHGISPEGSRIFEGGLAAKVQGITPADHL
jgi:hypothetical protein